MNTFFLEVPRETVVSVVGAADHRGVLVSARHQEFQKLVESFNVDWYECLQQQIELGPARLIAIKSGLAPGVYILPIDDKNGWFVYGSSKPAKPISISGDVQVCISYSSEDRDLALLVNSDLKDKSINSYLIDVAEDPTDSIWFLRFKTAMSFASYFIPILSKFYLSRPGSIEEFSEAWALVEAKESSTMWYPIIPILTGTYYNIEDPKASYYLTNLPGFKVEVAEKYSTFLELLSAAISAQKGHYQDLELWLSKHSHEENDLEIEERKCCLYKYHSDLCPSNELLKTQDGQVRLIRHNEHEKGALGLPVLRVTDVTLELTASSLNEERRHYEAACYIATRINNEGADASRFIELGKALELSGYETDALISFKEAKSMLNIGHNIITTELVDESISRLENQQPFVLGKNIYHVISKYASNRHINLPKIDLKDWVKESYESMWESANSIKLFFERASDYFNQGEHNKAEAVMIAAFYHTQSDKNRALCLYLAAKEAVRQRVIDRAIAYSSIGLDYQPDREELRDLFLGILLNRRGGWSSILNE
jgi:hypothetical protein